MNRRILSPILAALVLSAGFAGPASAGDPVAPTASSLLVSCEPGSRLSQRDVSQLLGSNNAGQVYAARGRLMAEVRRACHRDGVRQVALLDLSPARGKAGSEGVALQQ